MSSWQRSLQRLVGVKRKCLLSISCIIEKRKKIPEASLHFAQIRGSKDKGNWLVTSRRKLFPTSRRSYVTDTSYISEMYRVKNTKFSLRVKKTFASIFWKCSQKYMEMDFRRLEIHVCIQSKLQGVQSFGIKQTYLDTLYSYILVGKIMKWIGNPKYNCITSNT